MIKKWVFVLWMQKELLTLFLGCATLLVSLLLFINLSNATAYFLIIIYAMTFTRLFTKVSPNSRLNNYFIAANVPFRKCKIISQQVNRKHTRNMSCANILYDIKRSSVHLAEKLRPGNYRVITHTVILNHLQRYLTKIDGEIKFIYLGDISMKKPMKNLLKRRCYRKLQSEGNIKDEPTSFYYIEFHIPQREPQA